MVIDAFQAVPGQPAANPRDVTSERCGTGNACDKAVQADEVTVYSFEEKADAAGFAQSLGENGYQSGWIVLEYDGAAGDTDRAGASYASTVDGMWSSD